MEQMVPDTQRRYPEHRPRSDDYPMITIYCSLLGLIIITLLVYVIFKVWQQQHAASKNGQAAALAGLERDTAGPRKDEDDVTVVVEGGLLPKVDGDKAAEGRRLLSHQYAPDSEHHQQTPGKSNLIESSLAV